MDCFLFIFSKKTSHQRQLIAVTLCNSEDFRHLLPNNVPRPTAVLRTLGLGPSNLQFLKATQMILVSSQVWSHCSGDAVMFFHSWLPQDVLSTDFLSLWNTTCFKQNLWAKGFFKKSCFPSTPTMFWFTHTSLET